MLRLDNRENAKIVEMCYKNHTTLINPIIDWTDSEVWEFIREYNVPYCCLYDEGFKRLGCIGCPMGTVAHRRKEFERYPKYKALYLKAFEKMIEKWGGCCGTITQRTKCSSGGRSTDPNEWFEWWVEKRLPKDDRSGMDGMVDSLNEIFTN